MKYGRELGTIFFRYPPVDSQGNSIRTGIRKGFATAQRIMQATKQPFGTFHQIYQDGTRTKLQVILNGPRPLYIATTITPPLVTPSLSGYSAKQLESGLLLVTFGVGDEAFSIDPPFDVAIGEDLTSYFDSSGTNVSCADTGATQQIFQGRINYDPDCFVFFDPPPSVTNSAWPVVSGKYASHLYHTRSSQQASSALSGLQAEVYGVLEGSPPYSISSVYSGLMRLAAQSLLGAGTYVKDVYPSGILEVGVGIHLDNDKHPWWVTIDSSQVYFSKATLPDWVSWIPALLSTMSHTDSSYTWWLTVMFSQITGGETSITVTPTGDNFTDFTGFGYPIAFSWHHSRYTHKANLVRYKQYGNPVTDTDNYSATQQGTLAFAWDSEGNPSAVFTLDQDETTIQIIPNWFNLWQPCPIFEYCIYDYQQVWNNPSCDLSLTVGNEAVLYSYYNDKDELQELRYKSPTVTSLSSGDVVLDSPCSELCGEGTYVATRTSVITAGASHIEGGFSLPDDATNQFPLTFFDGTGGILETIRSTWEVDYAPPPGWPSDHRSDFHGATKPSAAALASLRCKGSPTYAPFWAATACGRSCTSDPAQVYDDWIVGIWDALPNYTSLYIQSVHGSATGGSVTRRQTQIRDLNNHEFVAIPRNDAEALYSAYRQDGQTVILATEATGPADRTYNVTWRTRVAKRSDFDSNDNVTTYQEISGNLSVGDAEVNGFCDGGIYGGISNCLRQYTPTDYYDVPDAYERWGQLTGSANKDVPNIAQEAGWAELNWDGIYDQTRNIPFNAQGSFKGDFFYYDGPSGTHRLTAGYTDGIATSQATKRWMGNA